MNELYKNLLITDQIMETYLSNYRRSKGASGTISRQGGEPTLLDLSLFNCSNKENCSTTYAVEKSLEEKKVFDRY